MPRDVCTVDQFAEAEGPRNRDKSLTSCRLKPRDHAPFSHP